MSVCRGRGGEQVHVDELYAEEPAALAVARIIVRDEALPEAERMRLMWATLDAFGFGLPGDER